MNKYGLGIAGIVALVLIALYSGNTPSFGNSINGGSDADACTTVSVSSVAVSSSGSTNLVATTSNRAYVRLELPKDAFGVATNTVAVSFNNGAAASASTGSILSTTTPVLEFGLNTLFPYTGTVTASSSVGGTSVKVTICNY